MDSIEELKQELELQKTAIESKGGVVQTTYTHPSPSEITAGINSIDTANLSLATASVTDVKYGKTFYAGNTNLKTGTYAPQESQIFNDLYFFENPTSTDTYYYTPEPDQTTVRPYLFCTSPHKMNVTLTSTLEEIGDYAFGYIDDLTVNGLTSATNLTTVGEYSLMNASNIDLGNLPSSITTIKAGAFANAGANSTNIVVPAGVTTTGEFAFGNQNEIRSYHNNFYFYPTTITKLEKYLIAYRVFDCDFTPPSTIKVIGQSFNYGGGFNNIVIPATIEEMEVYCFFANSADAEELFHLETVTFLSPDPPQLHFSLFPNQLVGKLKVYVPDESFDEYYNLTFMQLYRSTMYPLSQKE